MKKNIILTQYILIVSTAFYFGGCSIITYQPESNNANTVHEEKALLAEGSLNLTSRPFIGFGANYSPKKNVGVQLSGSFSGDYNSLGAGLGLYSARYSQGGSETNDIKGFHVDAYLVYNLQYGKGNTIDFNDIQYNFRSNSVGLNLGIHYKYRIIQFDFLYKPKIYDVVRVNIYGDIGNYFKENLETLTRKPFLINDFTFSMGLGNEKIKIFGAISTSGNNMNFNELYISPLNISGGLQFGLHHFYNTDKKRNIDIK